MILGAGVYQLPAIRRAKMMGYEVIVCSRPGFYPGIAEATRFYPIDTTDIENCVSVARKEEICGVLCPGTDVALPAYGAINEELGLSGPGKNTALLASNKLLMKQAFISQGVRTADYLTATSLEETIKAAEDIGFPVVVKAIDRSGSLGIEIAYTSDQLKGAFSRCSEVNRKNKLIVEKYLQGEEFGAQAFVIDGQIRFIMPHGDIVKRTEFGTVPIGHYVPYTVSSAILADVENQIKLSIKALGINNCAINMDFVLCNNKVYVLEIGARSGATCLSEMVSLHYSIDYEEYMIRTACGEKPNWLFESKAAVSAMLLFSEQDGILEGVTFPKTHQKGLVQCSVDFLPGTPVKRFRFGFDRIGHVIFQADNAETALQRMKDFVERIQIRVLPNQKTNPFS